MTRWSVYALATLLVLAGGTSLEAQDAPMPVSVGAGLRTSFVYTDADPDGITQFNLDSARIYLGGQATDTIKFMFNTEYKFISGTSNVQVMDAVARLEFNDKFNIWAGRFLPPSDRANLYGPYYAHHWGVFTDGLQDGYPFIFEGRDNGVAYWGQFGIAKLSAGIFDGWSLTGDGTLLTAARLQLDFWDAEGGYYLNGTYYGEKNLLAIGGAVQSQGSDSSAYSVDFLLERGFGMAGASGAFSIEAQWNRYDGLGGYPAVFGNPVSDGAYVLGSYLFPQGSGPGRFEVLGKYAHAKFREAPTAFDSDYDQKTSEFNLNYVIRHFNARVMGFVINTRLSGATTGSSTKGGVGLQIQM